MLSNPDYIYLDHPYEPHSEERGKYWATRYTNTRKIFGFIPEDLYKNTGDDKLNCTGSNNCSKEQENVVGKRMRIANHFMRVQSSQLLTIFFNSKTSTTHLETNVGKLKLACAHVTLTVSKFELVGDK